jgi:hypothetical protein
MEFDYLRILNILFIIKCLGLERYFRIVYSQRSSAGLASLVYKALLSKHLNYAQAIFICLIESYERNEFK